MLRRATGNPVVQLGPHRAFILDEVAVRQDKDRSRIPDRKVDTRASDSLDVTGVAGELTYCLWAGFDRSVLSENRYGDDDFPDGTDVKSSYSARYLLVPRQQSHRPSWRYVLVRVAETLSHGELVGWISASRFDRDKCVRRMHENKHPAYAIEQTQLNPMEEPPACTHNTCSQ
jgi:hypothetical protein